MTWDRLAAWAVFLSARVRGRLGSHSEGREPAYCLGAVASDPLNVTNTAPFGK